MPVYPTGARLCYEGRVAPRIPWIDQNWFNLCQTVGIVGGLALSALAFRRDTRARILGDYLTLAAQHRELWSEAYRRPELARIFEAEVDLVANPMTLVEEEFLRLVIVHFNTGWIMARSGFAITLEVLALDARSFFDLPLPRLVWEVTRAERDPAFVHFLEASFGPAPLRRRWYRRFLR